MSVNLALASTVPKWLSHSGNTINPHFLPDVTSNQLTLKQVFQSLDHQSCPHSYNFHMHTVMSDGKLQPERLIQQAIAIGLKGLAITDHHTTKGYKKAQLWLNSWKASSPEKSLTAPVLWSGVEISAGLLDVEVHILGYGFDPEATALQPYLQSHIVQGSDYRAERVIAAIQEAGGLAILAHPARYRRRPATDLIPEAARLGIDGVEVYYNYRATNPWSPTPKTTEQVKQLADTYQLLQTCGTDTHGTNLLLRP